MVMLLCSDGQQAGASLPKLARHSAAGVEGWSFLGVRTGFVSRIWACPSCSFSGAFVVPVLSVLL